MQPTNIFTTNVFTTIASYLWREEVWLNAGGFHHHLLLAATLQSNKPKGSSITTTDIEQGVGVSKEYNSFELNNALAYKDVAKSHKIVNYFAANPKNGPIPLVLGTLQGFFSKVWVCYHNRQKSDNELAGLLRVNPYFVKDYKAACAKYSAQKMEYIFYVLEEYDLRSKGIGNNAIKEGELLKELVVKILE